MKKIIGSLSVFLGLEFVICFVVCFFLPVPEVVTGSGTIFGYRLLGGVELFVRYFPAVAITGFIVSLSVYFGRNAEGSVTRFSAQMMKRFRLVMIITISIAAILTVNSEIFGNLVKRKKVNIENRPRIVNEYVKVGNNLLRNGYYSRAMRYADAALKLSPNNASATILKDRADVEINRAQTTDLRSKLYKSVEEAEKVDRVKIDPKQISDVYQYYLKSKEAFEKKDWFDAHYYAELGIKYASPKDPNYDNLKELSTKAWNNLTEYHNLEKNQDQKLFDKKYEGYLALVEHDDLKAYYIFRELYQSSRELQSDPDVVFYMDIAEDRINKRNFFVDETFELESFENANDVYFSYSYADGSVDIVYCKGVTIVEETGESIQYLRDLTIMSIDKNGNWFRTMNVPYAKVIPVSVESLNDTTKSLLEIGDDIELLPYFILKSVDREIPDSEVFPKYTYVNGETASSPEYIFLPIDYDNFVMLENSTHTPDTIPLGTLYKLAFTADNYGYATEVFAQVLMNRIYFPLWIIILFVLLGTFAWHNRINPDQYFKFTWVLAFPLFFIVGFYFYKGTLFIFKLINYALLSRMSVTAAFVSGGILYLVSFILASVYFLASRAKE